VLVNYPTAFFTSVSFLFGLHKGRNTVLSDKFAVFDQRDLVYGFVSADEWFYKFTWVLVALKTIFMVFGFGTLMHLTVSATCGQCFVLGFAAATYVFRPHVLVTSRTVHTAGSKHSRVNFIWHFHN
jgi:hypothetical protein